MTEINDLTDSLQQAEDIIGQTKSLRESIQSAKAEKRGKLETAIDTTGVAIHATPGAIKGAKIIGSKVASKFPKSTKAVSDVAGDVKEFAGEQAQKASEAVESAVESAKEGIQSGVQSAKAGLQSVKQTATEGLGGGAETSEIELSEGSRPVFNLSGKYGKASDMDLPKVEPEEGVEETKGEVGDVAESAFKDVGQDVAKAGTEATIDTVAEDADVVAGAEGGANPIADLFAVGTTAVGVGMAIADAFKKPDNPAKKAKEARNRLQQSASEISTSLNNGNHQAISGVGLGSVSRGVQSVGSGSF